MLKDFIRLYSGGWDISTLSKQDNENFFCFSSKKGLPIKLIKVSDNLNKLIPIRTFYEYFKNNPYFWMIPMASPNSKIFGFILRSYSDKDYRTVFEYGKSNISPVFGLEDFSNFKINTPIVLTEGVKDAIFIKQFYPYTLSLNTSEITSVNIQILNKLTNRLVLCYDNDKTGVYSANKDSKMLREMGVSCKVVLPSGNVKDCSGYFTDTYSKDKFIRSLEHSVSELKESEYAVS